MEMDLGLKGKKAIVTGGTRGIGRAIASLLAAEGCDVAICARHKDAVKETVATLGRTGIRATGIGTAVAVGRIGGVVSPYAGAWALDRGGPSLMFLFIAGTMTVVFAALASVRNHVPRRLIVRPVRSIAAQPAGR